MLPSLFRNNQKFRISFLPYQKLSKNYNWVKTILLLGNPEVENDQGALSPKAPVP